MKRIQHAAPQPVEETRMTEEEYAEFAQRSFLAYHMSQCY